MTSEPANPSPEKRQNSGGKPSVEDASPAATPDSLPVYLDDGALQSMEGETVGAESGPDADEGARLAASDAGPKRAASGATATGKAASGSGGRFSYFKALVIFLFAQLVVLLILGAVFRRPLTQVYDKLVDRGFVEPNVLPWQNGGGSIGGSSSIGDVAWDDVRQRYELILLADAAIARADRSAFDQLRGPLESSDQPVLRAAARAEIFRVQQMYASASRLPSDPLPVGQVYTGLTSEDQLNEEQIVRLLNDPDRPSEFRIRAAHLLAGHRTLSANDALILAVRKDSNLDVVKQAVLSFKINTNYRGGDLFDAEEIEKWWAENASRLATEFSTSSAEPEPAAPASAPSAAARTRVVTPRADEAAAARKPAATAAVPAAEPGAESEGGAPTPRAVRPIPADTPTPVPAAAPSSPSPVPAAPN